MEQFFQQLLNGLAVGGIYALVALGYTMVYGVLKLINFAHGDLFTIGAYLGLTLLVSGGLAGSLPPVLAVLLVFFMVGLLVALIGCALERVALPPPAQGRASFRCRVRPGGLHLFSGMPSCWCMVRVPYVYPNSLRPDFTIELFGYALPGMRVMVIAATVGPDACALGFHPEDPHGRGRARCGH